MNKALFLDRDGVLIRDCFCLRRKEDIDVLPRVPEALKLASDNEFLLIIISNQTVVARGFLDEYETYALQQVIELNLLRLGAPVLDAFYFCPHHPKATLPQYRMLCNCRKPKPGLINQAIDYYNIDIGQSYMVGDRITDVMAGKAAGVKTIQVTTGKHLDSPIVTDVPIDLFAQPDYLCSGLMEAMEWILQ